MKLCKWRCVLFGHRWLRVYEAEGPIERNELGLYRVITTTRIELPYCDVCGDPNPNHQ